MLLFAVQNQNLAPNPATLGLVEGGLTAILCALTLLTPQIGSKWFRHVERAFGALARRKILSVVSVGLITVLLRLAILPFCPAPLPFAPDDFSFLLSADTFLHGRLANPTPAMWTHFETIHVTMQPTYVSMYFPAQGLVLAAGKVLFGQPWHALLLVSALMCSAICWMLQGWLPANWALLGGLLAVLRLGVFSYWTNTYHAAGSLCALGGALILGVLPRLMKTGTLRYGLLMSTGIALLVLTRPYEGLLLCLPVAFVLGRWAVSGKNRLAPRVLIARAILPLALVAGAIAWLGYYDSRAFGKPLTLPYTVDRATYAVAPYYVWQSRRPQPTYRHEVLRTFYSSTSAPESEMRFYSAIHSLSGFLPQSLVKLWLGVTFFTGAALLPPLLMLRRVFKDKRTRFLVLCVLVLIPGMAIEIYLLPHYLAPFTAVFYGIGLQAMRHLRVWRFESKPVGLALVRFMVTLCVMTAAMRVFAQPLRLDITEWPPSNWNFVWYGPAQFGDERARIESDLEQLPGKQLVLVRYSHDHYTLDEWVYNSADIDQSKVIWAREMSPADNLELMRHYCDRRVWLVEPDARTPQIQPYPGFRQSVDEPGWTSVKRDMQFRGAGQ